MKKEITPLNGEDLAKHITDLNAKIAELEPHLAEGAHLITGLGAIRTSIACLENHVIKINTPPKTSPVKE